MIQKTLEEMVDEVVYEAMLAERPFLVTAVTFLVRAGYTPAAIEDDMRQRYGEIQMVRNVAHIAQHLQRQAGP